MNMKLTLVRLLPWPLLGAMVGVFSGIIFGALSGALLGLVSYESSSFDSRKFFALVIFLLILFALVGIQALVGAVVGGLFRASRGAFFGTLTGTFVGTLLLVLTLVHFLALDIRGVSSGEGLGELPSDESSTIGENPVDTVTRGDLKVDLVTAHTLD